MTSPSVIANIMVKSTIDKQTSNTENINFDTFKNDHGMSLRRLLDRLLKSIIENNQRYKHGTHISTVCLKQNVKSGFVSDQVSSESYKYTAHNKQILNEN